MTTYPSYTNDLEDKLSLVAKTVESQFGSTLTEIKWTEKIGWEFKFGSKQYPVWSDWIIPSLADIIQFENIVQIKINFDGIFIIYKSLPRDEIIKDCLERSRDELELELTCYKLPDSSIKLCTY